MNRNWKLYIWVGSLWLVYMLYPGCKKDPQFCSLQSIVLSSMFNTCVQYISLFLLLHIFFLISLVFIYFILFYLKRQLRIILEKKKKDFKRKQPSRPITEKKQQVYKSYTKGTAPIENKKEKNYRVTTTSDDYLPTPCLAKDSMKLLAEQEISLKTTSNLDDWKEYPRYSV